MLINMDEFSFMLKFLIS